ncbi:MAG: aminoacyl-tRNA hydrolase [Chlamydiota bacterium]
MQNVDVKKKPILVGLGNPGKQYALTRHNIGFYILDRFAERKGIVFKKGKRALSASVEGMILLKPQTYMNLSGKAVKECVSFYKAPLESLLVIVDDAHLPFGEIRMREQGSSGGHNGLKHIEECLQTKHYSRLRVGVGSPKDSDMADYVLANFTEDEQKRLPEVADRGIYAIELWRDHGMTHAMNVVNVHPKQKEKMDEKNEKKSL